MVIAYEIVNRIIVAKKGFVDKLLVFVNKMVKSL